MEAAGEVVEAGGEVIVQEGVRAADAALDGGGEGGMVEGEVEGEWDGSWGGAAEPAWLRLAVEDLFRIPVSSGRSYAEAMR